MNKYYIPYDETYKVNYNYILAFYNLAKYNKQTKTYNIVFYDSKKDLLKRIQQHIEKISESTLYRILRCEGNYKDYGQFLKDDSNNMVIYILNNITNLNKFLVLSKSEVSFLLEQNNQLLSKYYLYLKYYCQRSKNGKIDTTAKQFLTAVGYSTKSGEMLSRISECNKILKDQDLIKIEKYRDSRGYERNFYSIN